MTAFIIEFYSCMPKGIPIPTFTEIQVQHHAVHHRPRQPHSLLCVLTLLKYCTRWDIEKSMCWSIECIILGGIVIDVVNTLETANE